MSELQRGANVPLTRGNPMLKKLILGVEWKAPSQMIMAQVQVGAVLLQGGKALRGEDVIFSNQMNSLNDSVSMEDDCEQVAVDISAVPKEVEAIDLIAWVNRPGDSLAPLDKLIVRAVDAASKRQLARTENFAPGLEEERAICLVQLYRHGGEWKLRAKGLGWRSGMEGAVRAYGIDQL